jgi:hypothetical protein
MFKTYTHSTGTQTVEILGHNGEDMTQVRFIDSGTEGWVCDTDLSEIGTFELIIDNAENMRHSYVTAGVRDTAAISWLKLGHTVQYVSVELVKSLGAPQ